MKPRTLLLVAGAVFIASFFLPAYSGSRGVECFNYCWGLLWKYSEESDSFLKWLYYAGFVVTNVAFVLVLALSVTRSRFHITGFIVSALAFFHVLSWLCVNMRRTDIASLQVGYYLWLLAYALLLTAQIGEGRKSKTV
jgi:hypothetical protein